MTVTIDTIKDVLYLLIQTYKEADEGDLHVDNATLEEPFKSALEEAARMGCHFLLGQYYCNVEYRDGEYVLSYW